MDSTYLDPMPKAMDFEGLRIPPHSIEAESSLLGALMLDNEAWDQVAEMVTESDFYRHEHRLIFHSLSSSTPSPQR